MNKAVPLVNILFLTVLAFSGTLVSGQKQTPTVPEAVKLEDLFKANSYDLRLSDGRLAGSGYEFLIKATARAQFFAIAEPHNSMQLPKITSLLFNSLRRERGFEYLALEQ